MSELAQASKENKELWLFLQNNKDKLNVNELELKKL